MSSISAQKGRRNLPKLSPRVKKLQQYQKLLNNNTNGQGESQQTTTRIGLLYPASIGAQSLAQLPKADLSHQGEPSLLTESTSQLPSIKKSFSQHKLSSRQRFVMQKYNLPIPDAAPPAQHHQGAVTDAVNVSHAKNMPLRTIQPGAASGRLQHSNSGIRPSNLSIGQDQMPLQVSNPLHSDYSSWLMQPNSLDNELYNFNNVGNHNTLDN